MKTKMKLHRLLSLLLCCVMLAGMVPNTVFAAGDGTTEATALQVTTYAELKAALEDTTIFYVEVPSGTTIDEVITLTDDESNSPSIKVAGNKTFIVNGNVTLTAGMGGAVHSMLYVYGSVNVLSIKGNGSLTFRANASNSANAVVYVGDQATLKVSGNVALTGSYNNAVYGTAIRNVSGSVYIDGGSYTGELAKNSSVAWGGAIMTGADSSTFIQNATLKSNRHAGEENEPVVEASLYVAKDATVRIRNTTIETTENATAGRGHSIYTEDGSGKTIADCLYTGQKVYKLNDTSTQFATDATSLKSSIYIGRGLPNEITSLALGTQEITTGTVVNDMRISTFPDDKVSLGVWFVYAGLNATSSGTALAGGNALNPAHDYSAIYVVNAVSGKTFVSDLTKNDITFANGVVTKVELSDGKKTANIYVNFPKDSSLISELSLGTQKITTGTVVNDMSISTFPNMDVSLGVWFVYAGLNATSSGTALAGGTALNPANNYSAIYAVNAVSGKAFASDFSKDDITFTNGVVTKVELVNENRTANVYVNFRHEIAENEITSLALGTQAITAGTVAADMTLTTYPDADVTLFTWSLRAGLEQGNNRVLNSTDVLNPARDYCAVYVLQAATGKTFASDLSKEDITFANGVVTKIKRTSDTYVYVYVDFPKDSSFISDLSLGVQKITAGTVVNDMRINTFPSDKVSLGVWFVYAGWNATISSSALAGTNALDLAEEYSAIYVVNAVSGKIFASDFSKEDITFANGVVTKVELVSGGATANVYVNLSKGNIISDLSLGVQNITAGTKVNDMKLTTYPDADVALVKWELFDGLDTQATAPVLSGADVLNPANDYCARYVLKAATGKTFASDLSKDDITFANGVVTKVVRVSDRGVYVYVNFPKDSGFISDLSLGVQKITAGTVVNDMRISTFPNDKVSLGVWFVYAGWNATISSSALAGTNALDPAEEYSAIYVVNAVAGKTFASDFSKEDITFTNGVVTKVELFSGGTTANVYVNFPHEEAVTEYDITVTGGKATDSTGAEITKAAEGTVVTLTADAAPAGKEFDKWVVESGSITLADADSTGTTFTMPAGDVKVWAAYTASVHTHSLTLVEAKSATCTGNGNRAYYVCDGCNMWFEDAEGTVEITDHGSVVLSALGHDYSERVIDDAHRKDVAADSGSRDTYWYDCSRCDHNAKDDASAGDKWFESDSAAPLRGDMDGSGKIELGDAQTVLKAALRIEKLTPEQEVLADVDENGSVELKDAQLVLKRALRIIRSYQEATEKTNTKI